MGQVTLVDKGNEQRLILNRVDVGRVDELSAMELLQLLQKYNLLKYGYVNAINIKNEAEFQEGVTYSCINPYYLPIGTHFFVNNGCWNGEIVERDGKKHLSIKGADRYQPLSENMEVSFNIKIQKLPSNEQGKISIPFLQNELKDIRKAVKEQTITPDDADRFLDVLITQSLSLESRDEKDELLLEIEDYRNSL